ncbi:MAG: HD domain-containing protein [Clostridium sp.]|uniref:HD domain-containing protein n=1 Tax=Clostridium sp. TaxID=1506 RepID=UPI00303C9EBB
MYNEMFQFVRDYLITNDAEITNGESRKNPFRKRSEHIQRVFMWVERLIEDESDINKEAVLVSAIFHDVGYALKFNNLDHAENSATICEKYLKENGFSTEFINLVTYLVRNHSNKELMTVEDTTLELTLLMEADLLDETGALSVVWDCMVEGSERIQSFENTHNHIINYSYDTLKVNPMVTDKGKKFWEEKQQLVKEFVKQLSFDLGINEESARVS